MHTVSLRAALIAAASFVLCHCGDDSVRVGPAPDGSTPDGAVPDGGAPDGGCASGCTGTRAYDAQSYTLRGHFDWSARKLIAEEQISLTLTSTEQSVVALDGVVDVERVSANGSDLNWAYDATQHVLHVNLASLRGSAGPITFVVNYEAAVSGSLIATHGGDADPVTSRVVYTDSEPDRARNWLVSNDHPSDRARWSVELTVPSDEDVIANGTRVRDETKDGSRIVGYQIATPLPTYLMAFAAGQIEHSDRTGGRVPLSVWYRRGLLIDTKAHLDLLAELMTTFEKLAGPYPFDRYSVVLLPEFPAGGMENATITFNYESSGQGNIAFSLNAHELSHHWFGDWVTMRDYDDVWFKEGMATVLESEAQRAYRDQEGKGRLFGADFGFKPTESVVDKSLKGLGKYNSGPYRRAAWMITQIRARIGEDAFWASLRDMLASHAAGTIDGEGFVRSFARALDPASITKILGTLEKKPPPAVTIDFPLADDGGTETPITLSLTDPSSALLDPIDVSVIDADGNVTKTMLAVGTPVTVKVPVDGYFAYDDRDAHPNWTAFSVSSASYNKLVARMVPSVGPALTAFETRSAAQQERLLTAGWLPPFDASALGPFYDALDSRSARRSAAIAGCDLFRYLGNEGGDPKPWADALEPLLKDPAIPSYNPAFASCGTALPSKLFSTELTTPIDPSNAARRGYLLGFDYGPGDSFTIGAQVATQAPSAPLRNQAISRLVEQASGAHGYTPVPPDAMPAWKEFFRARLQEATSEDRFDLVWGGVTAFSDATALALAGPKLHSIVFDAATQRNVVCNAYRIAITEARLPAAWEDFRTAAKPWETLAPEASAALRDPSTCAAAQPIAPTAAAPTASESKARR